MIHCGGWAARVTPYDVLPDVRGFLIRRGFLHGHDLAMFGNARRTQTAVPRRQIVTARLTTRNVELPLVAR